MSHFIKIYAVGKIQLFLSLVIKECINRGSNSSIFVSPAKQKRDICTAFPAAALSSS